ncbi:hypothetical protein KY314_00370 [Candidatus Woesearchaeota archaeon]|nr:hypothetical protein [Candidatus Woesearchaeota archaeon]
MTKKFHRVNNLKLCRKIKKRLGELGYEQPDIPIEDYIYYWGWVFPERDSPPVIGYYKKNE